MKKVDKVNHGSIVYAKSEINYTRLFLDDGSEVLICCTLKRLLPQLKVDLLVINKGIAINTAFMGAYQVDARGGSVTLLLGWLNTITLEISRRKAAFVKKSLKTLKHLRII